MPYKNDSAKISIRSSFVVFSAVAVSVLIVMPAISQELISVRQAVTQPQQAADYRLKYGPHIFQFGDLRLPSTEGPHPVVVIVHGGCWSTRFGLHLMDAMAERLTELGLATWNIEFRRVGQKGSAWPDTFDDVAFALRYVDNLSDKYNLDTDRIVLVGHSSGGHLALWLANQALSRQGSELNIRGVVALAPVADLLAVATTEGFACRESLEALMGGTYAEFPERYQAASPAHMKGIDIPVIVVSGDQDNIIPSQHVQNYADTARKRGIAVQHIVVGPSGHFEMVTPAAKVWSEIETIITSLY